MVLKRQNKFYIYNFCNINIFFNFIFLLLYDVDQNYSYFLIQNRFWELSLGCLTYLGFIKFKILKTLSSNLIFTFLILIMFLPFDFGRYSIILAVFLTSLLLLNLRKASITYKILTNNIFQKIGRISFSLYLWHWVLSLLIGQ